MSLEEFWTPSPVIGWRFWWKHTNDGTFRSLCRGDWHYTWWGRKDPWPEPDPEGWYRAVCARSSPGTGPHSIPVEKAEYVGFPSILHACGFWAWRLGLEMPRTIRDDGSRYHALYVGLVELGGTVIEHEHGYRGRLARPIPFTVKLATPPNIERTINLTPSDISAILPPVVG